MRCSARVALIVALAGLAPAVALAQGAGPQSPTPSTPAPAPTDASAAASGSAAPAKPVVPATGYGWRTTPAKPSNGHGRVRAVRVKSEPTGSVIPGFETLADGSTRLFVQLPKPVTYAPKAAKGSVTYVLKGVRIDRRNNLNALVTVHFNTPVSSARLVPHGNDLWFVVDLRANVQPTVTMDATKDGGAMLRIEFPKGDYLGGTTVAPPADSGAAPASPPASAPTTSAAPAPMTPSGL
jgi:hypothetical protein